MSELSMTEERLRMLRQVAEGQVVYNATAGYWYAGDDRVSGWAGRTLSALRRSGYIELQEVDDQRRMTAILADRGRQALP